MKGTVHRLASGTEARHRLVRRRLFEESAERIETACRVLDELRDEIGESGDYSRLDFTLLSSIRAESGTLVGLARRLRRNPFGRGLRRPETRRQ